jgi:hypothetical protein
MQFHNFTLSKMQFYNFTARKAGDETIPGTYLQAFIKSGQDYFVAEIKIYKDGVIDCYGEVDLEGFKEKVRTGRVKTRVPEGARVSMMNHGIAFTFTVTNVRALVEEEEFVKQVEDEIRRLNGQPTTHDLCRKAMDRYEQAPTEENKEQLRQSYVAVPKHLRVFLGDIDSKDWDYLDVLGIT